MKLDYPTLARVSLIVPLEQWNSVYLKWRGTVTKKKKIDIMFYHVESKIDTVPYIKYNEKRLSGVGEGREGEEVDERDS